MEPVDPGPLRVQREEERRANLNPLLENPPELSRGWSLRYHVDDIVFILSSIVGWGGGDREESKGQWKEVVEEEEEENM